MTAHRKYLIMRDASLKANIRAWQIAGARRLRQRREAWERKAIGGSHESTDQETLKNSVYGKDHCTGLGISAGLTTETA
jgi:hypothetical protein